MCAVEWRQLLSELELLNYRYKLSVSYSSFPIFFFFFGGGKLYNIAKM